MREIKFRAWHKDIKEMFEVGQITLEKGMWDYQPENRKHIGISIPYQPSFILMQYTGLKDKNGKEIYEGDIVEITRPCILERGEVKFINGCFVIKSKDTLLMLYQCEINNFKLKVIGNIYDNPDLLEEGVG